MKSELRELNRELKGIEIKFSGKNHRKTEESQAFGLGIKGS